MVKSKAEDYNKELKSGEIEFAQHNLEFQRFYEKHKRLCDEMSGLKIRTVGEVAGPDRMIITRVNFGYAIKNFDSDTLFDYSPYFRIETINKTIYGEKKELII